jgi:hypothetical protein
MNLFREKLIFATASVLGVICTGFVGYLGWEQANIEGQLLRHGFDRAVVITANKDESEMYGGDAQRFIAAAPSVLDGPQSLLSRESVAKLRSIPEIASIMAVSKSSWKLNVGRNFTALVDVLNAPPEFMGQFGLGASNILKSGEYVPSSALQKRLGMVNDGGVASAIIGVPDESVAVLPTSMRDSVDWTKARVQVILHAHPLDLPAGISIFDNALFTTGREQKIAVPGLFLVPTVSLFVKFREGADVGQVSTKLADFLATATPSDPKTHLAMIPLTRYFSDELGIELISAWADRVRGGLLGVSLLLVVMLALIRFGRVRVEVAVRRALGATTGSAVWLSTKIIIMSIIAGISFGVAVSICISMIVAGVGLSVFSPILFSLGWVAMIAIIILTGCAGFGARRDVMATLRSA